MDQNIKVRSVPDKESNMVRMSCYPLVSSLLGVSFGTGNQDEFKVILTVGLPAFLSPGFFVFVCLGPGFTEVAVVELGLRTRSEMEANTARDWGVKPCCQSQREEFSHLLPSPCLSYRLMKSPRIRIEKCRF